MCCGSWGHKESDTTERLTCTELIVVSQCVYSRNAYLHNGPKVQK